MLVTHHLEELPSSTTHALLLADGRVVAAGPARAAVTTENVSAAFDHPIDVQFYDGRWLARAARRSTLPSGLDPTGGFSPRGPSALRSPPYRRIHHPSIITARLELREFSLDDADLVREVAANAEQEALPPGAPSDPKLLDDWLAADDRLPLPDDGTAVHLMMLDRSLGRIVGSISVFHADWETKTAEIGYGVRADERGKGYATEALHRRRPVGADRGRAAAGLAVDHRGERRLAAGGRERRASASRGRCAGPGSRTTGCTT